MSITRFRSRQELTVPYSPDEVWRVLSDVAAYPQWWPATLPVKILRHTGGVLGSELEVRPLVGRMFRFRFEEVEGRSIRLRFFRGALEGPGGFHLFPEGGSTRVLYEMDVFTRGLGMAALSMMVSFESIHEARMRSVLKSMARRLKSQRKAAEGARKKAAEQQAASAAVVEEAARTAAQEAKKSAKEEAAARRAAEEAGRVAALEAKRQAANAAKAAKEEAARLAAENATRLAAEKAKKRADEDTAARPAAKQPEPVSEVAAASRPRPLWGWIANWLRESPAPPRPDQETTSLRPANFDLARLYLDALSSRATPEEIGRYFAPEATEEEFPHRFLDAAVTRELAGIIEARARALARFGSQQYELTAATGGGSQVAMQVRWTGSVATTGEGFTEGQELEARIALFLKFADGKIVRQRTYACFEPWSTKGERTSLLDERNAQTQSTNASRPAPGHAPIAVSGSNFEIARSYLGALEARADAEAIARFHAVDAVQIEFPNRFLPAGAHRDLQAITLARSENLALLASERYELLVATGGGSVVGLEVAWSGVVGEGVGPFITGQRLEARLGLFLTFRDGLIVAQRTYAARSAARAVLSA